MKRSFIYPLILLIISLTLIFLNFNLIPKNISFDEIEFSKLALSLNNSQYVPYSTLATGHSTLYFYILLLSFKIFGVTNLALRLPSAIFGLTSIFIFFAILKIIFKEEKKSFYAIIGTIILITSRWFVNFSRFSFEATFLLFLELLSLLFILLFLKNKKRVFLFISSIFAGLSFLSYTPGRFFLLIPIFILFIKKFKFKYYLFYFLTYAIISAPLTIYLFLNNDIRIKNISVFSSKSTIYTKIQMISENIQKTALMFNYKGDMNGRHNYPEKPALNPILGVLFILGIILAVRNIHDYRNKLFLFYFLISISPTLITLPIDNPNMLRTFTALPSVIYFIMYSIKNIVEYKFNFSKKSIYVFICLLISLSSIYELNTYFKYQSRVFKNSFEVKCTIDKVIDRIPKKCLVNKNEF